MSSTNSINLDKNTNDLLKLNFPPLKLKTEQLNNNNLKISKQKNLLQSIKDDADYLVNLESINISEQALTCLVIATFNKMSADMEIGQEENCTADEIHEACRSVRDLMSQSPIFHHMQTWPRGYEGDFEIVTTIVQQKISEAKNKIVSVLEKYILSSDICQQHRNKITFQSKLIEKLAVTSLVKNENKRLLSIACGGSQDVAEKVELLAASHVGVILSDMDSDALRFSLNNLKLIEDRVQICHGNFFLKFKSIAMQGPFDLILAGGLFDYLTDKQIILTIRQCFKRLLTSSGQLFFTNIAQNNPAKLKMQHLINWTLIERSEARIKALIDEGSDGASETIIERDATGLTFLVQVNRCTH